ncbi:MAG: sensor histidine kinase [Acidobacteriota bacterium]
MAEISSSRRLSWTAVGFAFASILLFITLVGLQAISYTDQIGTEIQRIQREQEKSDQILDELRTDTSAVAIELRDYLMASPADSVTAKQRFFRLEERMNADAGRLQGQLGSQVTEPVQQLRQGLERYRRSIAPIFNWSAAQRQAQGAELLRKNVVPERAAVLSTTREIESLRSIGLRNERAALVGARQAFRKSMLLALLALLSFVFIVALVTSIRLRSLERQARSLQLQTERDRENLRDLSLQMVRTQEDERRSISRELHDQVGQLLTAIQMQFSRIETSQEPSERNLYVREGKALVYRTVTTVRDMAMGLRPSILDDLGLIAALEWQAREFKRRSGIALSLKLDGNLSELPDGHRTCLYRIVQEALTNCGRHADAKHVELALRGDHDRISLTIRDDGKGFDPEQRAKRGLGLVGVEERVRELGGKAKIHSQLGRGTLLEVEIPSGRELHV